MTRYELEEKVSDSRGTDDFFDTAVECLVAAIKKQNEFCTSRSWSKDDVRSTCSTIGEYIDDEGGISLMQQVYYSFRAEMGPVAARFLEHYWNGVGEWRG